MVYISHFVVHAHTFHPFFFNHAKSTT